MNPRLSQIRPEGTAGQYPKVNATKDGWDYDTPSGGGGGISTYARAKATTSQSISNATWTAITLDTVELDTDSLHSSGTPSRYVIATTGVYELMASVVIFPNATGIRALSICKNGLPGGSGTVLSEEVRSGGMTVNAVEIMSIATGPVSLMAGDYVNLGIYQNSGISLNVTTNDSLGSWLGLIRLA